MLQSAERVGIWNISLVYLYKTPLQVQRFSSYACDGGKWISEFSARLWVLQMDFAILFIPVLGK